MLCRCETHEWPDSNQTTVPYVAKVAPAGSTNEAIICGRCKTPGSIFLNRREYYAYEHEDERFYTPERKGMYQLQVSDSPEEVKTDLTRDENNPPEELTEPDIDRAADADW